MCTSLRGVCSGWDKEICPQFGCVSVNYGCMCVCVCRTLTQVQTFNTSTTRICTHL